MISSTIRSPGAPAVLAVFSFRYDAHLVPAMLENIAPFVDGWVSFDDRGSTELFSDEPGRRFALLGEAMRLGAKWVLAIDPDERIEARFADHVAALTARRDVDAFAFPLREMYGAERYRIDGVWGTKQQVRLLSLAKGIVRPPDGLHRSWAGFIPDARIAEAPFNIYHLKMITRQRRRGRARLYEALDPGRAFQPIGYRYLAKDWGARFERIPHGRDYLPAHVEDGGLWMPEVAPEGSVWQRLRARFGR